MKTTRSFRLFDLLHPHTAEALSLTAVTPLPPVRSCVPRAWLRPLAAALFSSPANAANCSRSFLNGHVIEVPYK